MRTVLVVAFLGAVSVACSPKKQPPVAAHSPLADSADQVIYGLRFRLTDEGLSRAQLHADTAYFFDDNTRIEMEPVNTTFFTTTGAKDAVLTSKRGTYNSRTSNMIARKNVVVVSEDGRRLTTEELKYNQQKNEISSDSAFVMTEPNRRLEGIGFRSDPNMKNIQILKGASGFIKGVSTQPTTTPAQPVPAAVPPPVVPKR
ncbi:MAG TPA: LPS export ABC transporter periplasmic protein LptC [Gemmatimonadaceae bacterium]|nr:LPS export ABC transporter periplasmic protein LptC [Gemmatimonadaceae bacterium]